MDAKNADKRGPTAPMNTPCRSNLFHRTAMLVGKPAMDRLLASRVAVFGVGGVGSWSAESLVRSGIEHLTIVDSDVVCSTNINRQLQATALNVGKSKVEELKKRLLEINPRATIDARHIAYTAKTCDQFDLGSYDYVLDAIDSLQNKILLIERSLEAGTTLFSCMGAGAKLDPTQVRTGPLSRTRMCPLAKMVRKHLGKKNISKEFLCVYSEEPPGEPMMESLCGTGNCACSHATPGKPDDTDSPDWCAQKKRINGTVAHVTAVFGFTLAGLVIQDIAGSHTAAR
ncbi:MAG: tRNA threonylcarbamoyladenosine dehydratase [bacterium]